MRRQKQFAVFHLPVFHRDWGKKEKTKNRKKQKIGIDKKIIRRQNQFAVFHLPVFHRDWGVMVEAAGVRAQHFNICSRRKNLNPKTLHTPKITFERTNNLKTKNIIKSHF